MIIFFRKRLLIIIGVVLAFLALAAGSTALVAYLTPPPEITVVIDPGHGGRDTGVTGINSGLKESDLNLIISKNVKALLEKQGIRVILTRTDENGLYEDTLVNLKRQDMAKRKAIIEKAEPDLVVSIHCNKFPDKTRRGAQVFFEPSSESSISLSKFMQSSLNVLNKKNVGREFPPLKGDYYILKCSRYPSVIVECGFLSNPEDDALIATEAYRAELSDAVYTGILAYIING